MSDPRRRFAESLLKQSQDRLASANRLIYVWLGALILVWVAQMEPTRQTLLELANDEGRLRATQAQVVAISREDPSFAAANERLQQAATTVQPARERAATITFQLPGLGGALPVATRYAPLIWQGLALGLLLFIASTRVFLLRSVARAGRILVNELRSTTDDVRGHAGAPRWWLYPLPHRHGVVAGADALKLLYDQSQRASSAVVLLFFVGLIVIQSRVVSIGFLSTMLLTSGAERVLLRSASVGLLIATVCLVVRWFTLRRVPDAEREESDPNIVSRRQWIGYGGAVMGGIVLVATAEAVRTKFPQPRPDLPPPDSRARIPRYRRRKGPRSVKTRLPSGWYRNRRSRTVHFVTNDGTIRTHGSINEANFEPLTTAQILSDRERELDVNSRRRSFFFEQASLAELQAGRAEEACRLLVNGLARESTVTPPDYRLYDLLAAVAVRQERPMFLQEAVGIAKTHPRPERFAARIVKWTDANSKWHKALTDTSSKWSWSGLPM